MRTTHLTLFLIAALLGGCTTECHPVPEPVERALYRREVNETNRGGKDLVMTFQELSRDEKTSTAKVTFKSGASVPSIMFVVRGFYDIAKARDAGYFIKLKEWKDADGGWMYLVGFSSDRNIDPQRYFGLAEALPKGDEDNFMVVKDYDLIFKQQQ